MSTEATNRLAIGEIGAESPAGQHTDEQAGSHDCERVVAPTGQGITASLEARAGRTHLPAESNFVQNMTTDSNPALTPSEEEVQKPASAPSVQPQSSNGCTPEVASGCPVSTLSNTTENKSEGVNLPAAAEGEPSAEAESGSSAATNSNYNKAMKANQTNPVSSGQAEEDAQGNSCVQTVQPSVELNACAASPGETEQIASPQAEPPYAVSTDSINSDAAVEATASAEAYNYTPNTITNMSTSNDTPANGSVSDVNAADVSNITSENAAALASANLNSGTDCATTFNKTMNKSYTTKCSVVRHKKPSFNVIAPMSDEPQMITLSYSKGHPSNSGDVHPSINRRCYHDGNTIVSASGSVDDSVSISAPGLDYTSSSGATHSFGATGTSVPAGYYDVSVTHSNIQSHPAGNVSVLTGSVGPVTFCTIIPDENDEVECDPCSCTCQAPSNTDGGSQPGNARAVENITIVPFTSSSGGSGVVRTANARHMRFAFAFGSFRGMGNVPGGQPEIVAFNYDASLLTPAALTYKHPLASILVPEGDSVDPNEGFRIFDGAAYANYIVSGDGSKAFAVGATSKKSEVVRFVAAISKDDSVVCNLSDASYVRVSSADDSAVFYDLESNEFAALITSDGATVLADEKLSIIRDAETGIIRQIWNYWDGLADVVPATEGNGYTISLYLPSQLTAPVEEGQLFTFTGDPFKTFTISGDAETQSMTIRERDWSLPENTPDYVTTWTHSEAGWNKVIGEEDDVISETRVKSVIVNSDDYQIVTTVSKGGVVASCVCEVFTSSVNGELCISRTEAYGSDIAQTTTFEYDEAGREVNRVAHHGGVYETVYDKYGRVTVESSPWAGGQKQLTSTIYREANSYNSDPAKVVQSVVSASGGVTDLRTDTYAYTEADGVRRVEINSTAAGSSFTQNKVEETWLSTAENVYARGRVKMRQAVNGVQTHYEYAATAEHNALYTVTAETRVNGVAVAGQSRRTVEYISAAGNTLRKEEYALLADGETWALLSGVTNTYDVENRLVGTLKDNGRSTTRTLNCSGQVLTETDEDGVTTTYGYNTARQLVEVIREEIKDGDVVVTPETITTYTHDAAGRTLSVRKDIGAMTTTEYSEYDLLGRTIRKVDILGRATTTSYSTDGLTSTVTTPAGATFITVHNTDGSTARIAGTGQREQVSVYDLSGSNRRTTEKLADGTIIGQVIVDGFDQTIVETAPATNNRYIYTRSEYNAKGQLVKQYQDTGFNTTSTAPTLYEYDSMGNVAKKTLALSDTPTKEDSPIVELTYSVESQDDGIYSITTQTRYNAAGQPLSSIQKQLISQLSITLENKMISVNERGLTSTNWTGYNDGTKRIHYSTVPTSNITAETVMEDDFALMQKDTAGIVTTATRSYTAGGMVLAQTDGRGNTTTTVTDIAGRTLSVTDAAGNVTATAYDSAHDLPATITDAQGNTTCYRYDSRGRKVAEWGTATQPACFGYDEADNMTTLRTFRAGTETISTDPSERPDADETTWVFDAASGLELSKTYADGSSVVKTYDAFNRLATETDARGIVKTHSYETARGLHVETRYSNGDTIRSYVYNHVAQLTQEIDDAGTRAIGYNAYGEKETDSLLAGDVTHIITEIRDAMGRSTGYTYSKNGEVQHTVTIGYDTDGRIATAGFMHGGSEKQFSYGYLPGSNLLQTLTMPCNMTLTQNYETHRDLLIGMTYHRGSTLVAQRTYSYDTLGRPLTRSIARNGQTMNDSFVHNSRSELASAQVNGIIHGYEYDNIGNRRMVMESNDYTLYEANALNQYTSIQEKDDTAFVPSFDTDGNQTLVKTSTGIWSVQYNAENRPVCFTSADNSTIIECVYDTQGRRATKKVITNGSVTLHQRYIYHDYLQIATCDLTRSNHPCLWLITWDPSQPIATRPLAIRKDGTWYAYGWDLTKNICEVFGPSGYIRTAYTYSPYGEVTATGDVTQPIQWSSEYNDTELALIYYNYRHYHPVDGRWIGRDKLEESDWLNVYGFVKNGASMYFDQNGNGTPAVIGLVAVVALFSCALYASKKAIDYSANDKQQHCYTTCIMTKHCGGKLTAVPIAVLKEFLDVSYELLRRELGFISRERYMRVVVDSIKDYYADMKCIDAKNEEDCKCCCKTA